MTHPPLMQGRIAADVQADGRIEWVYPPGFVVPPGYTVKNEILIMPSGAWVTYELVPSRGLRGRYLRWRYPHRPPTET